MANATDSLYCWLQQFKLYTDAIKTGLNTPSTARSRSVARGRPNARYESQYRALLNWYNVTYKNLSARNFVKPIPNCSLLPAPTTVEGWKSAMTTLRNQFSAALTARGVPPSQTQGVVATLDNFLIALINNLK